MNIPNQQSPENLELIEALHEQMEADSPPADESIGSLCKAHRGLVDCLNGYDRESAVRLISALETIPSFLGNTIRIQVLLHLALGYCNGPRKATTDDLRQWIAFMNNSPMARLEDPSEDVFVGYVCTSRGGFRVYPGIFSNADFILERLIIFLVKKTEFPGFKAACNSVIELLRVSDAIADELGQARYSACETPDDNGIPQPLDETLASHCEAVHFDSERLARLGIDSAHLEPFFFTHEYTAAFASEPLFGSTLELHPLVSTNDGFIVASPSVLCRAALVHALKAAAGLGGWADSLFGIESAEFFINEILPRLGITPIREIKLPVARDSLPPIFQMVGQFDFGMPVVALTMSSLLTIGADLEKVETFTNDQIDDFAQYLSDCCEACESVEGFHGGLVLVGLSSLGRPLAIALKKLRPRWHFFSSGLADWLTLVSDEDFTAKRLWYLGLQQALADESNLEIVNTSGLLNLYAYWKGNDYALVHQSVNTQNPHNSLVISGSYSLGLNNELKSISDRHCLCPHAGAEWVILQRQGRGLNPDLTNNLMYVDYQAASSGLLCGCVEYGRSAWWVEANGHPNNSASRSLFYRLWECVFNWLEYTLPVIATASTGPKLEHLRIELEFLGMDDWPIKDSMRPSSKATELSTATNPTESTIRLIFSQGFLTKFYRADNLAEREIVAAIIRSAAEIAQISLAESEIQQLVVRVTKNQDTRFFHIVNSSSLESAIGGPQSAEPTFVPPEEITRARTGLAYRVTDNPPEQISDPKADQAFLDKAVAKLQVSLSARLKELHILPVVSHSFSQLDELSRDGTRWSLSTRSLLALAEDAAWL